MTPLFNRIAFIGIGLIGSSLARKVRENSLAGHITIYDSSSRALAEAEELGLGDEYAKSLPDSVRDADLVLICAPVGAYEEIAKAILPSMKRDAILSDVGSVKEAVVRIIAPLVPSKIHFIPGHPVAGTEYSGPKAGFSTLFEGRWTVLTPLPGTQEEALAKLKAFWEAAGSQVEIMDAQHHDQVMAIVSHLPHLIAYTIVGTAVDLEESAQSEVIKFSASGFRDFTRIAASDPIMWRDIFLHNKEAVLEMLGRFTEDLTALQRAIRWGEGHKLQELFTRTREIRRSIIDAKQA